MATNTDASTIIQLHQHCRVCAKVIVREKVSINTLVRITLCSYKNVVFMSAMMSRISIHIHSVVLVERKPVFLMVKKLSVLYKVISGQNTHVQSGCNVYTTCSKS